MKHHYGVFLCIAACSAAFVNFTSTPVPLADLLDNQAASTNGTGADFDGIGSSYDAQYLPTGTWTYDNVPYALPTTWGQGNDNILAQGQTISLPNATFAHELHMLYAGDGSSPSAFATEFQFNFADNTTQRAQLVGKSWWTWASINTGVIFTPYHFTNTTSKEFNLTEIYQWSTTVVSESPLVSITLPQTSNSSERVHIFAVTLTPSAQPSNDTSAPVLAVRRATFSQLWDGNGTNGDRAQVVHVALANMLPDAASSANTTLNEPLTAEITGPGLSTVSSGVVNRLNAGDQARFDVLVTGATNGTQATVTIKDAQGTVVGTADGWPVTPLETNWTPDAVQLRQHETPTWWNNAKYGIFIHWGVYSVPAWGPPNEYAEWYNWYRHMPDNPTWQYHLDHYGADFVYDQFIANFTASKFNASAWLDLFDNAGAKYFVQVTKHHEGFALFDTGNTTNRSSVALGPKRDLLRELVDAAKAKPWIHPGTYYSLPEWFNPDYTKYGFGQWPGGPAHNAYNTSELEPYFGRLNISDYLTDLQLPHMLTLAEQYGTEIMWCDIGGPNKTLDFAAAFYNNAVQTGKQVTLNNRCGAVSDFDTPEYATFDAIQTTAWESSEGMDPFSYGLNQATNASQYKNGTTIITTLVDIASKNGNFLLDIGPTAEGEIIAPMVDNLLDAGSWLKYAGDCVYNTTYRFKGPQNTITSDVPVRFLTTPSSFCIVAMSKPSGGQLVVHERVPVLDGDTITLLSPNGSSSPLDWSVDETSGALTINVSDADLDAVEFAWAFQAKYKV